MVLLLCSLERGKFIDVVLTWRSCTKLIVIWCWLQQILALWYKQCSVLADEEILWGEKCGNSLRKKTKAWPFQYKCKHVGEHWCLPATTFYPLTVALTERVLNKQSNSTHFTTQAEAHQPAAILHAAQRTSVYEEHVHLGQWKNTDDAGGKWKAKSTEYRFQVWWWGCA